MVSDLREGFLLRELTEFCESVNLITSYSVKKINWVFKKALQGAWVLILRPGILTSGTSPRDRDSGSV